MPGVWPDVAGMFYSFLEGRPLNKKNLYHKFGLPTRQEHGWFRFRWRDFDLQELKKEVGRWKRAWHGCKLEALYSIAYHGQLFESRNKADGERILSGLPGVYVHKDKSALKAENYLRFIPINGFFWAAKWEVFVDRNQALDEYKATDQWIQPQSSVRLSALWLCVRTRESMWNNAPVARKWDPQLEANPASHEARSRQPSGSS